MARETLAEEREGTVEGLFEQAPTPNEVARVAPEELARWLAGTDPPLVLDVRSRSEWARDRLQIPGSVRVLPDHIAEWAASRPDRPPIVTYCT